MITDVTIVYLPEFLYSMLDYMAMANGPGMPPPWNSIYDLNGDGFINVKDVLLCLASLSF